MGPSTMTLAKASIRSCWVVPMVATAMLFSKADAYRAKLDKLETGLAVNLTEEDGKYKLAADLTSNLTDGDAEYCGCQFQVMVDYFVGAERYPHSNLKGMRQKKRG